MTQLISDKGAQKKLLPSSYSDGAPKMCNICVCKYCAHICNFEKPINFVIMIHIKGDNSWTFEYMLLKSLEIMNIEKIEFL